MKSVLLLLFAGGLTAPLTAQDTCDENLAAYEACSGRRGTNIVAYEANDVLAENGRPADGITGVTSGPVDGVTGFSREDNVDADGSYLEYTLRGRNGTVLNVSGLDFGYSRDSGGPRKLVVRSSADGFASDLFVDESISTGSPEYSYPDFDTPLEGEEITLRIYLYGAGHGDYNGVFYLQPFAGSSNALQVKGCPATTLPVELTAFTAEANGDVADLAWSTATEQDNDYFAVELSADGASFSEVGRVAGAGTTNLASDYSFSYSAQIAGTHYFRLRQVDLDGRESFSPVVAAQLGGPAAAFTLTNTVAGDELVVEAAAATPFRVLDASGNVALAGTLPGGRSQIGLGGLPPGLYVLTDGRKARRFVR